MDWTLRFCAVAAVMLVAAGFRPATARASDLSLGATVAVQIQTDVSGEIDAALAVSSSALDQVGQGGVVQFASTASPPVNAGAVPAVGAAPPNEPVTQPGSTPTGQRGANRLEKSIQARPRARPQARGRLNPQRTEARPPLVAAVEAGPERALASASAALRSGSRTSDAGSGPQRHVAPALRLPLPPSAPAPGSSGASAAGHGGAQGGSLTPLLAALASFIIVAISLLRRKVFWWTAPTPRRVALPPWRPG